MSRITITQKANGRFYLGMDETAFLALARMLKASEQTNWKSANGHLPSEVQDAGDRILTKMANFAITQAVRATP